MLQMAKAVRVPRPIKVISSNNTTILLTEYIQFSGLKVFQGELGNQLAVYIISNLSFMLPKKKELELTLKCCFFADFI